ncbi:hydroxymethylglutaryl-CoA lyase [Vicingus serpentipes]|uniref:Hydroxymethylglutaryl-CoA lyase n=1 Tax=Vicingus serpentipes TaxID=1926625 RepID=A0A5C6RWB4_9FLAO|nr:hydroxymethylglutaryl-CoA lyase [Vicingus serpentipes]TXB65880.1 hydroxymethylglutaryl-CoA lyase [Vicingus serpentipes]
MVKLIECPRDAMQGLHDFIPTETKANYINQLLKVGFDTIDFGSFVSPKAIPQMRDTADLLTQLDLSSTKSKLLAIIANQRGANDAIQFNEIDYLGFPFSISETFQQRNTNSSISESLTRVEEIQSLCVNNNKKLVVYISMAFGNPYGDKWNSEIVIEWTKKLADLGIEIIALSDTIGVSNKDNISSLFNNVIPEFTNVEIGAHLHTTPDTWLEKVDAAYQNGCRRFDGAIKGFGGCPMAKDDLTGNMATENLIKYFNQNNITTNLNNTEFENSLLKVLSVFPS